MIDKYEKIRKALKVTVHDISKHRVMDCTNIAILNEAIIDLHDAKAQAELNARVLQKIADGDDWFDIESAPRDMVGTGYPNNRFLVLCDGVHYFASWAVDCQGNDAGYISVHDIYRRSDLEPTHWKHIDGAKHIEMLMEREMNKCQQ